MVTMSRWIAHAAACLFFLLSFASNALTLEALPGSTPQTTCFSCVFPNPVGVVARDDTGAVVAGVAVTFTSLVDDSGATYVGMVHFDDFCCVAFDQVTVVTGANGVAIGTPLTIGAPGKTGGVTASADGANNVAFTLSSNTERATTIAVVSGGEQTAQTGTPFAAPWKVRVLDAAGHPVPNSMVRFYAGGFGGLFSSAHFPSGFDTALVVADANGIATSPIAIAGDIVGDSGFVDSSLMTGVEGEAAPDVSIEFHVVSFAITTKHATLVSAPPPSLMEGTFAAAPYVVRLLDATGHPAVGMPVVFSTDCGSAFDGALEQIVLSDAKGLATSALLEASVPAMCNIGINAGGVGQNLGSTMHVFDPNNVVVTPRAPWIVAKARHSYQVVVDFTESGLPIQPASLDGFGTIPNPPNGPAGITGTPTVSINGSSATITARANQYSGLYDLQIIYFGPSQAVVHVLQVP
jgi:hypothetical protein